MGIFITNCIRILLLSLTNLNSIVKNNNVKNISGEERQICPHCGKTFKTLQSVQLHIKSTCEVKPKYMCTYCGMKLTTNYTLKRHLREVHWNKISQFRIVLWPEIILVFTSFDNSIFYQFLWSFNVIFVSQFFLANYYEL